MSISADDLRSLVEWHKSVGATERQAMDQAQLAFEGDLKAAFDGEIPDEIRNAENMLAAPNLISKSVRAIATALSYNNPAIYVRPDDPETVSLQSVLTGGLARGLKDVEFSQLLKAAIIRALVMKRSGWKQSWDSARDLPKVSVIDPRRLYFDRDAAIWRDVTYYVELIEMPEARWKKKLALPPQEGGYKRVEGVEPSGPTSALAVDKARVAFGNNRKVVYVWEYYDIENGYVCHWPDGANELCFEADLAFDPYTLFSLDTNGVNCLGSSEANRLRRQQKNQILGYYALTKVMAKSVPGLIGDASAFDDDDQEKIENMGLGDVVFVDPKTKDQNKKLGDLLVPTTQPVIPPIFGQILSISESDATDDARYSETQAGKSVGFRTAFEASMAKSSSQSAIADKEGNLNEAVARFADKFLYLLSRYRQAPIFVMPKNRPQAAPQLDSMGRPLPTDDKWPMLTREMIRKAKYYCEIGLYNPARRSPDVYAEILLQNLVTLGQFPEVRRAAFLRDLFAAVGLPVEDIKSDEEMAAEEQAAAQAAMGAGAPGAAPGGAPPAGPDAAGADPMAALQAAMGGDPAAMVGATPGAPMEEPVQPGPRPEMA